MLGTIYKTRFKEPPKLQELGIISGTRFEDLALLQVLGTISGTKLEDIRRISQKLGYLPTFEERLILEISLYVNYVE